MSGLFIYVLLPLDRLSISFEHIPLCLLGVFDIDLNECESKWQQVGAGI